MSVTTLDGTIQSCDKCGRDMFVFTTKRLLLIDMQDWSGTKAECGLYFSIPWQWWSAFEVQTAGSIDDDMEVAVWAELVGASWQVKRNIKQGEADPFALQAFLESKMLPPILGARKEKATGLLLLGFALTT